MRLVSSLLLIMMIWLLGCAEKPATADAIRTVNQNEYQALVSKRAGRPLVVSFWATWCTVCENEIPEISRMYKELKKRNVDMVSISADYSDEIENKVRPFIKAHGIDYPVYVKDFADDQNFINTVNEHWSGALPATVIYDATGEQVAFFEGAVDMASLEVYF